MIRSLINILVFLVTHPLNKGRKVKALIQFLRWQIGARLLNSQSVVHWVNETKFIAKKGETGVTGNIYCGLMEFEDMSFLLHFLRSSDEFFDIGANVGAYTILASGVVGAKTICFEPVPDTFDRLMDQININRVTNLVHANNKGVGDKSGILEFTNEFDCMNRVNTDPHNKNTTNVEVVTLDKLYSPSTSSLVKIDVEGYESFVLGGGELFFANTNVEAVIIELNGSGEKFGADDQVLDATLRRCGYESVNYDPFSREVVVSSSFNRGGNTIYVRDIDKVKARCASAETVVIHTVNGITL